MAKQAETTHAVDTETGEILEVEILAPDVVKQAITKFSVTDAALAQLKAQWEGFKINGVEDKEGYAKAAEGYRTLKKLRTGTEAKRKALKEPFLNAGKMIDAEAKRITAVIGPLEDNLEHQVKLIDQKLEALRREEELRRKGLLTSAGFQLSGQFYALGPVMVLDADVMAFSDEKLQEEIARGVEWAKAEADRKAKEQAELEELRRLKAENEAKAAELAKQQAELEAKAKAIEAQKQALANGAGGYQPITDDTSPEPPQDSGTTDGPGEAPQAKAQAAAAPSPAPQQQAPQAAAPQPQAQTTTHPAFKAGWNQGLERAIQLISQPDAPARKRSEWADVFREQLIK